MHIDDIFLRNKETFIRPYYLDDKKSIGNAINTISNQYEEYKKAFPLRIFSQKKFKHFYKEIKRLNLFPSEKKFVEIITNNEIFEALLCIIIKTKNDHIVIRFPLMIQINKLTDFIKKENANEYDLDLDIISKSIHPDTFLEYNQHMQHNEATSNLLPEKIRKKNPIIYMLANDVIPQFLINGNHRAIAAIKKKQKSIKGYIVNPELCSYFGITTDYTHLVKLFIDLSNSLYGVDKSHITRK